MKTENLAHYIRSALFVDFDNVFGQLQKEDKELANQFATRPDLWLSWLERELPPASAKDQPIPRRILVRKCYLNPQAFFNYRPHFITSAFEVVDCPPLTTKGKTSTDIHMVIDILDTLYHRTVFDEFIILSGDSDFTPVVLRLRSHDRRSVILAAGFVSPAYKSACDYIIDQDTFIKYAIGFETDEEFYERKPPEDFRKVSGELLDRMARKLLDAAKIPYGVQSNELPSIYMEFDEFRNGTHWLGFFSLRKLTEELVSRREDLIIIDEDPWRVSRIDDPSLIKGQSNGPERVAGSDSTSSMDVRQNIADLIIRIVKGARSRVPLATLALAVRNNFAELLENGNWLGSGSFKGLLLTLDLGDLKLLDEPPGYVYDPRHREQILLEQPFKSISKRPYAMKREAEFSKRYPVMAAFAKKISQLTDTPYLLPEDYGVLLGEIAREVNERGYNLNTTSKTVRDRCVEKGAPISRADVNFVLRGITYTGHRFGEQNQEIPEELGDLLFKNVLNLCATAQLSLDEDGISQIREWIMSKIYPNSA